MRHPINLFKSKNILFLLSALLAIPLTSQELSPSHVFEMVKASVAVVKVLNSKGQVIGFGSGVKLPSGCIVTNHHVVKDGAKILVGHGKTFVVATIHAGDPKMDLCLLDAPTLKVPAVMLGSASVLKVGAVVYAIGSPQGLELSLSNGLVSQLRGGKPPIIQTTAAISPGSSGGGLFDGQGHLVGITSFYLEGGQSLNFALPVEWIDLLKPDKPRTTVARSSGDWLAQAAKLEEGKKWKEFLDWCQAWVKVDGNTAIAWGSLGDAYSETRQFSEAIEAYQQALKIDPEVVGAWYNLGNVYWQLANYSKAIEAYHQALAIDPESASAWCNLGKTHTLLKQHSEALEAYSQALRVSPENAILWNSLGNTYCSLKRHPEALEAFRHALKIDPEFAGAWYNLGRAYSFLKRHPEAIDAYLQALRIKPSNIDALYLLGLSYDISGNKAAAMDTAKQLRKIDPGLADRLFDIIIPK